MSKNVLRASAALLASCALAIPIGASSQTAMTGSQQTALLQYALVHFDAETHTLATMRNHIPSREIVTVAIGGLTPAAQLRGTLSRSATGARHAAVLAALGKATVADVDRNNGQSPDQSSLAEYLQHLNVDPNSVVVVDVNAKPDPQNPHVTVFYRKT